MSLIVLVERVRIYMHDNILREMEIGCFMEATLVPSHTGRWFRSTMHVVRWPHRSTHTCGKFVELNVHCNAVSRSLVDGDEVNVGFSVDVGG